jgi:hypothetical protein
MAKKNLATLRRTGAAYPSNLQKLPLLTIYFRRFGFPAKDLGDAMISVVATSKAAINSATLQTRYFFQGKKKHHGIDPAVPSTRVTRKNGSPRERSTYVY